MSTTAITYIGHATTVIQTDGVTLYTDPHFGSKALCIKRKRAVPIPPDKLPKPDVILITHAHYDHLDLHSFKYFSSQIPVIVPTGLTKFLVRFIRNPIVELTEGAEFTARSYGSTVQVRAVKAVHKGGRLSGLRFRASNGYLIQGLSETIYFQGDTAYAPDLKDITQEDPVSVALLPIGPCSPKFFMQKRHMTPDDALRLCDELGAKTMIPIHWGVFRLGFDGVDEPLDELKQRLASLSVKCKVVILEPGQKWEGVH